MTLEAVSRGISRLAREGVIEFTEKGRRAIGIPDPTALERYLQRVSETDEVPA